ncbi:TlpA family protein disulfide reductase [bacterium]|nr:MAG: TlpA family protein disulfide reductase [bacterium]
MPLTLATALLFATTAQEQAKPIVLDLELSQRALDMDALEKSQLGYMPSGLKMVEQKPAAITKEPAYKGKPLYGFFALGDGPKNVTHFAVDYPKGQKGSLYVDVNQNGDLTDDGPGKWDETIMDNGVTNYQSVVTLHASWGTPTEEREGGDYTILLYGRQGDPQIGFTKVTARAGKLEVGGKTYNVLLSENQSDALFAASTFAGPIRRPNQLLIDLDGDGTFKGYVTGTGEKKMRSPEVYSLQQPVLIGGKWWRGEPSVSGAKLTLTPSEPPSEEAAAKIAPAVVREPLAPGKVAPDFKALTPKGKPIKLSDFKGKVVLLDFWATWCGPCQAAMPGLQKIYNGVKSQGVVVLSINVWDAKGPFDDWIAENSGKKYTFTFAYDSADRDMKKSIASAKYGVSGIPTMFVIDRAGKIRATIVGSGEEETLVKALAGMGIKAKG